jgi:hypothetical protein
MWNNVTPGMTVILWKLIVTHLDKKFLAHYGTTRLNTVFTRVPHWSAVSEINPSHIFNIIPLMSILILSSHQRLSLPSNPFPSEVSTKFMYAFLISLKRATCPGNLLNLITLIIVFGEE